MPFTFNNYRPSTPEQQNPFNAAISQAFKSYGQGVQARYAPQAAEADIFSKKFLPLAQIASNPTAMAMMGDSGRGVMQMISQLLQQGHGTQNGGLFGGGAAQYGGEPPISNTSLGGGNSINFSRGQNNQTPPNYNNETPPYNYNNGYAQTNDNNQPKQGANTRQDQDSPVTPTGKNLGEKLVQGSTSSGNKQLYPDGTTYVDEKGNIRTTSGSAMLNSDQVTQGAAQSVLPLMEKLDQEGSELLGKGKWIKKLLSLSAAGFKATGFDPDNLPQFIKDIGVTPDYYRKYVQFEQDQDDASAKIGQVYNYGDTETGRDKAKQKVSPTIFEDSKSYNNRIKTEIKKIKYQNELAKQHTRIGFNASREGVDTPPNPFNNDKNNQSNNPANQFLNSNYKSAKEFESAFNGLDENTKNSIYRIGKIKIGGKTYKIEKDNG